MRGEKNGNRGKLRSFEEGDEKEEGGGKILEWSGGRRCLECLEEREREGR